MNKPRAAFPKKVMPVVWRSLGWTAGIVLCLAAFRMASAIWPAASAPISVPSSYAPASVVFNQPLHGHYVPLPAWQRSLSPDLHGPAPRLQLPQTSADLGQVSIGGVVEHTFMVRNAGQGLLHIERLYTTCPCLTAHLTASVIPPGQMALLTVRLDPAREADTDQGTVALRRGVFLESNDPVWPQASVWVEATIGIPAAGIPAARPSPE